AAKVLVHNCGGTKRYDVGMFSDLSKRSAPGDGLQIHHAVQKHPAGQVIKGYDPNTGPSIALPNAEHARIKNLRGTYSGSARDLMAPDLRNLRNAPSAPNAALQVLARTNKEKSPDAFKK